MADNKVTMKNGKEILEIDEPTFAGVTALESLGWKVESGKKPARPKAEPEAEPFDEAKARAEIEAQLRAELEADAKKSSK